jgi:DNA repair exonuclease SbcCD nuclease subunit
MTKPYALVADVHAHAWSTFATVESDGVNSRLRALLTEIHRAAVNVKLAGGNRLVVAGDLFHVRGSIAPSVLNPVMDMFKSLIESGIEVIIIPGNHDLEGKNSDRLNSAITALEGLGCKVVHETTVLEDMVLVPWIDKVDDLKVELKRVVDGLFDTAFGGDTDVRHHYDLIIHAPIDGVIMGIPDHGLDPKWLADLGCKRVFAGHYHNHKVFYEKVYSIGALAHNTWSDVGSRAGFCIVHPDSVEHVPSVLPKFVDVAAEMKIDEIAAAIRGNYARVKVSTSKLAEINAMREWLDKQGALGVVVISVKKPVEERGASAATVTAGASIQQSVSDFIKTLKHEREGEVTRGALAVLAEAEVV